MNVHSDQENESRLRNAYVVNTSSNVDVAQDQESH
jgi:hypothetical protein